MSRNTTTAVQEKVNGVDVTRLKETIGALQKEPTLAAFKLRARNRWLDGSRNRSEVKDFYGAGQEDTSRKAPFVMHCDEPVMLAGQDQAANPVEHALHALAGCLTTTLVYHAAARGIAIESIKSELEGDIDVRGFLGLSSEVRKGLEEVRVTLKVKSDASEEKLLELAKYSPVYDSLSRPVNVVVRVEKA